MDSKKHLEKLIPLYLYDELNEEQKEEFEVHINYCEHCSGQLQAAKALHKTLEHKIVYEPSEALLKQSRARLRDRLREERVAVREPWRQRLGDFLGGRRLVFQVARAAALLVVGFLTGQYFLASDAPELAREVPALANREEPMAPFISNVDLIQYDPNTGKVTVQYKTVTDIVIEGKIDDPDIRRVLVHAIRTGDHPGRRLTAVKASSMGGFSDEDLEDALIFAMETDRVDGVRLKAVKVLKNRPINARIKWAFIRVLLKDPNSAIRLEALEALDNTKDKEDVAPIFKGASRSDKNEAVRLKAAKALQRLKNPQPQENVEN